MFGSHLKVLARRREWLVQEQGQGFDTKCFLCLVVFSGFVHGLSFLFHRSDSAFDDLVGGSGCECLHLRWRILKTKKHTKKEKWVHSSSDRICAKRSCALVRLEGDAAALKARPLLVQQTVMLPKRRREVAAAERRHVRRQRSLLLGDLGPEPSESPVPKTLHKHNNCTFSSFTPKLVQTQLLRKTVHNKNCTTKTKLVQHKKTIQNKILVH